MKSKRILIWTLVATLLLVSAPFGIWKAEADTPYPVRILEIVDNGDFVLQSKLSGTANVTVETMRMKTFVAQRNELSGKYDAIYFGKGTYSPKLPQTFLASTYNSTQGTNQKNAHNTTELMNDITATKMDQIQKAYIDNGLPVIFYDNTLTGNSSYASTSNMYKLYNANKTKSNVLIMKSDTDTVTYTWWGAQRTVQSDLTKLAESIKSGDNRFKQRPQLVVQAPSAASYKTGDKVTFNFQIYNMSASSVGSANINLYASVDKVLPTTDENLVSSTVATANSGQIVYTVPSTYSGPLYWRLSATFAGTASTQAGTPGLQAYSEGSIMLQNEMTNIRVLQVMTSNDTSSLSKAENMVQSYLNDTAKKYSIAITPITFANFADKNVYQNLNGKYDMIIFGFSDEYGRLTNSLLTKDIADYVKAFIQTGQAVMFTHDTILVNSNDTKNNWSTYFGDITGQNGVLTNLGYGNPFPSSKVQEVNSGMLTQFPFDLRTVSGSSTANSKYYGTIASTHNQYYMADLNDSDVVVWYNINNDTIRDNDDSYDHYYTYSKGNVTYSGTGHTNNGFPDWEKKLFVNTMYRAYIGSNHAPTITVTAPVPAQGATDIIKKSYLKNLTLSYQVDDLDLKDLYVWSTVRFKNGDKYLTQLDSADLKDQKTLKGTTITKSFENPFPDGGVLTVEIEARDKLGAKVVKSFNITIEKEKVALEATRTLKSGINANQEAEIDRPVTINYAIKAPDIKVGSGLIKAGEQGQAQLIVSSLQFNETIPAGLSVDLTTLPTGMTASPNPATGATATTLSMKMKDITYTLNAAKDTYIADLKEPITFDLKVTPTKLQQKPPFTLDTAAIQYQDLHSVASAADPAALALLKQYGLIVLNDGKTSSISNGTVNGRAVFSGSAKFGPDSGGFSVTPPVNSATAPAIQTGGDLNLENGGINNGPLLIGGSATLKNFGLGQKSIIADGSITIPNSYGMDNTSIWAGANLSLPGVWLSSGSFYAVNNFSNADPSNPNNKGGMTGGSVTYGGTSNMTNDYTRQSTPAEVKKLLDAKKKEWSAQTITDFAALKQSMLSLSDTYGSMKASDTYKGTNTTFTGTDDTINVFSVDGSQYPTLENITVKTKPNATIVLNVTGGNVAFSGGFDIKDVTTGQTLDVSNRLIVNYTSTGKVTIAGRGVPGTLLAPKASIAFQGGTVDGMVVAADTSVGGSVTIKGTGFTGSGGGTAPTTTPVTVKFPDLSFAAVRKVSSIQLQDKQIWIGDQLKMTPTILPADATNPALEWSSLNPDIVSISADGTITGLRAGTATIQAKPLDGGPATPATAKITVVEPGLKIDGPDTVRSTQSISLTGSSNSDRFTLSNPLWTIVQGGTGTATLLNATTPTVSLTGVTTGTVNLQLQASLTNSQGVSRPYTTTKQITVQNGLTGVQITGPSQVNNGGTIDLGRILVPSDIPNTQTTWTIISSADTTGKATLGSPNNPTTTLTGQAPGKITVQVSVTTGGTNPQTVTDKKEIWVLGLDLGGATQVDQGQAINLNASLLPSGFTGTVPIFNWSVVDKGSATGSNAQLATLTPGSTLAGISTASLSGVKPGVVTVTAQVNGLTVTRDITIRGLDLQGGTTVDAGSSISLDALILPNAAALGTDTVSWSVTDYLGDDSKSESTPRATIVPDPANPTRSILTGSHPGLVEVTVKVGSLTKKQRVRVQPSITQLQLPAQLILQEGSTHNLLNDLNVVSGGGITSQSIKALLTWTSADTATASVNTDGLVNAIRQGTTQVVVKYQKPGSTESVSAQTTIIVQKQLLTEDGDRY